MNFDFLYLTVLPGMNVCATFHQPFVLGTLRYQNLLTVLLYCFNLQYALHRVSRCFYLQTGE